MRENYLIINILDFYELSFILIYLLKCTRKLIIKQIGTSSYNNQKRKNEEKYLSCRRLNGANFHSS
jgi:hypothetical protein